MIKKMKRVPPAALSLCRLQKADAIPIRPASGARDAGACSYSSERRRPEQILQSKTIPFLFKHA
jgi:hypothetical protein